MSEHKTAPVQGDSLAPGGRIPWAVHELAWAEYHKRHPGQSAERIAQRGGFSWIEVIACLRGDYTHDGIQKVVSDSKTLPPAEVPK